MKVLVVHADLRAKGGAESYADAVISRLKSAGHTVGILDITGHRSGTDEISNPSLFKFGRALLLNRFTLWKYALVCRILPKVATEYGYVIFSFGEGPNLSRPTLQLRHAPAIFSGNPELLAVLGVRKPTILLRQIYAWGCRKVARMQPQVSGPARTVTNTHWTASMARTHCNIENPYILYPKVNRDLIRHATTPRNPYHMVCIGRIVPNKRLEDAIAVLERLNKRGLPATLQIIGRADGAYANRFIKKYKNHPGLIISPNADKAILSEALAQARLGLHGFRSEHFGIAVAEMICSGVLPLVHNSGGVCELVQNPELRFETVDDLTEKALHFMQIPQEEYQQTSDRLKHTDALQRALNFDALLDAIITREITA